MEKKLVVNHVLPKALREKWTWAIFGVVRSPLVRILSANFDGACVNLNAIRVETPTVALPAAALLITLIVLIRALLGAVPG